ncbi:RND family efflux transporter MFP subunit [Rhizomicrobium palustre]|uniref:RND family efflux transporter MFP subunit n=1 Tax=Rhizomicrobium palustre TaxID=189966 RepID=A0A846N0I8_9PROT|nr:efflux RND transporter periplasmic adaptor subunit [Rhizomicrobium palustre]NIK88762.1 RND family efflux transporter MFP subunit [Rhizomicrobium palustre]
MKTLLHAVPYGRALATALGFAILAGATVIFLRPNTPAPAPEPPSASEGVLLSPEQKQAAGIKISAITPQVVAQVIRAPGEVKADGYSSKIVGPRITATVVTRHARLGDVVHQGQPLVTLYSQAMAEAQSGFVLAERDLARYTRLHESSAIAPKDYDQAVSKRQELYGRLLSFGLTQGQIAALSKRGLSNASIGQFDLLAPISGTVSKDDFRDGEVIVLEQEGRPLFEITDPKTVWVEARLSPALAKAIGSEARVTAGGISKPAKIVQGGTAVDEATRTVLVRLEVQNADLALRPGQFVDVEIFGDAAPALSVPSDAVLRDPAGAWVVYIEGKGGALSPHKVIPRYSAGARTVIDGIAPGTLVVTSGAFFVQSEAQKSSFAEED